MTTIHRAGLALAVVAGTGTLWAARRRVVVPESASPGGLEAWYSEVGAEGAALTVAWTAGTGIALWLAIAIALQVLSTWLTGLQGLADAVSPRGLRRLAPAVASLSLSAGIGVGGPALPTVDQDPAVAHDARGEPTEPGEGTATMTRLDLPAAPTTVAPTTTSTTTAPTSTAAPTTTSSPSSPFEPSGETPPAPEGPSAPSSSTPSTSDPAEHTAEPGEKPLPERPRPYGSAAPADGLDGQAPPAVPVPVEPGPASPWSRQDETIRVEPGMSFWSIAEDALDEGGKVVSEREVARYWLLLIEVNRDRLVAPHNPDLLLPGQELLLPAR